MKKSKFSQTKTESSIELILYKNSNATYHFCNRLRSQQKPY